MTTEAITPLRQRMIEDMNARKLCAGTQRGHIRSCKRFAAFLKRSPATATGEDIRTFQLHLADTGISICNRNRIMTGLRFLFRVTLRRSLCGHNPELSQMRSQRIDHWVCCRNRRSRARCCISRPCCSADFARTNRILGRPTSRMQAGRRRPAVPSPQSLSMPPGRKRRRSRAY